MEIRNANLIEADKILQLDAQVFPADWLVSTEFVETLISKNPTSYRVAVERGQLVGFYCTVPLRQTDYQKLLNGELAEKELPDCALNINEVDRCYIYVATINVDQSLPTRAEIAKELIKDLEKETQKNRQAGIDIPEIGAIAITKSGEYLLRKMQFKQAGVIGTDKVFIYKTRTE